MSDFYQRIADHYDYIFPLNKAQVYFVKDLVSERSEKPTLLDIGCGTGNLGIELANSGLKIEGIDLNESMIEIAQNKAQGEANFRTGDMLQLNKLFPPEKFELITCFGNTLVHLPNLSSLSSFLNDCGNVLTENGIITVQIINYDRILDQQIDHLPTIENDQIKFVRNYRYNTDKNVIHFDTELTIKLSNTVLANTTELLPIRKEEMEQTLLDSGYKELKFYGNFKGEMFDIDNSQPLIITAKR